MSLLPVTFWMRGAQHVSVAVALYIYVVDVFGSTLGQDKGYPHICLFVVLLDYPNQILG